MRLCVEGRRQLYDYCEEKGVPYRKTGKLVVSLNEAQSVYLEGLHAVAGALGTPTHLIPGSEAQEMEPDLSPGVCKALHSPETGIFSSHDYMKALEGDIEDAGGDIVPETKVQRIDSHDDGGWVVQTQSESEEEPTAIHANTVVNAAGLQCVS